VRVDLENASNGVCCGGLWVLGERQSLKKVKAARRRVGLWWKGCRRQLPKASFSAAFSQIQRLMR